MAVPSMLTRLKKRLSEGGPAMIVAIIALCLALCGGAFAATASKTKKKSGGVVITKLSQISPSVRKQLQGAQGAPGAPGAKGDAGAQGSKGDPGSPGSPGADGIDGKSVEVEEIPLGEIECQELGGANVRVEGQEPEEGVEVCNGASGEGGTAGATLAPGSTETGIYSQQTSVESAEFGIFAPISFPTPIDSATRASVNVTVGTTHPHIQYVGPEAEEAPCLGNFEFPQAEPGYLCIYQNEAVSALNTTFIGTKVGPAAASTRVLNAGTYLEFAPNEAAEAAIVAGSFAITGCTTEVGEPNECP